MMKKNNISNLVNLSQKGSNTAFEILFTTFKTRLHNSLFKILKNFHETEDVVQQAFLRAWEKIGTFKGESNFYLAITKIKTSRESQIDEGFEQTIKSKDDVQNEIQNIEFVANIRSLLDQMPEEQRNAYILCEIDGKNYEEIAYIVGVPVGTVRSRIFRARQFLVENLKEKNE